MNGSQVERLSELHWASSLLPKAVTVKSSGPGAQLSILCAVMRLDEGTFPACSMLGPGESRPKRRIVEVVMMLVLQDPACAAAESGLIPVQRHRGGIRP